MMLLSHKYFPTKAEDEKEFPATTASAPPFEGEPVLPCMWQNHRRIWKVPGLHPTRPLTAGSEEETGIYLACSLAQPQSLLRASRLFSKLGGRGGSQGFVLF